MVICGKWRGILTGKMNPANSEQQAYYELSYYTLAHPDPNFIHQHIVDAFGAQEQKGWALDLISLFDANFIPVRTKIAMLCQIARQTTVGATRRGVFGNPSKSANMRAFKWFSG